MPSRKKEIFAEPRARGNFEYFLIDDVIPAAFHRPVSDRPVGIVICLHGLLSHKESSKFIQICNEAAGSGFIAVRFDQAGAGESREPLSGGLIPARLKSIGRVVSFATKLTGDLPVFIVGSSLGGYLAFLYAWKTGLPSGLVSWAAPFDMNLALKAVEERFNVPLGEPASLDVISEAGSVTRALIIHGTADEMVPPGEGYRIYEKIGFPKELVYVSGADHRFLHERKRLLAVRLTLRWLKSFL